MDVALAAMPLEHLEAELCIWSANLTAAEFRWFELLAEFDRREGWQQWGASSCAAWMCWQLGLDSRTAREKLRVARALTVLPLVCEQMRQGRLPYSKVRAITRIAEPANEAGLVSIALAGTTHQVERVVAGSAEAVRTAARQADDGRCRWLGDRLDLDWTLTTLFSQTPWHDPWRSAWLAAHDHPARAPAKPG